MSNIDEAFVSLTEALAKLLFFIYRVNKFHKGGPGAVCSSDGRGTFDVCLRDKEGSGEHRSQGLVRKFGTLISMIRRVDPRDGQAFVWTTKRAPMFAGGVNLSLR